MMSHINGDITRTRELLSQAVHHLDSYNATRYSPATSSHNQSINGRQNVSGPTTTSSDTAMSSHANLHYSLVPPPRQQESSTFSQRQSNVRPRSFRPTFHPGRPAKKKKKLAKWQNDFVCLASTRACKVPCNMDKAELIRAGLGLQQLSFFLHGDSSDFYDEIVCAYPKLRNGGGFELLRSCEGNSKELAIIPPPPAGYTVSYLKSIMGHAKVYIRPLQTNLSMEVVHCGDEESAPKETCNLCGKDVPMHMLREHLQLCNQGGNAVVKKEITSYSPPPSSPLIDLDDGFLTPSPVAPSFSPINSPSSSPKKLLCTTEVRVPSHISTDVITEVRPPVHLPSTEVQPELRPSSTKDLNIPQSSLTNPFKEYADADPDLQIIEDAILESVLSVSKVDENSEPQSTFDCVAKLRAQINFKMPTTFDEWIDADRAEIDVRRDYALADALKEGRKKRFNPTNLLKVCFIGEPGVDTGGPSREFFRLFMMAVDEKYCCGQDGAKVFMHDVPAIQESHFRTIGIFVAMSIIQGGFGLPIFSQYLYSYLVTGKYVNFDINNDDIPDPAARALLQQIDLADTDEKLRSIFIPRDDQDDVSYLVTDTGYRVPLTHLKVTDKPNLCKAVREYHTIIKILPEMNQFGEGLEVLGVLSMIRKYPELLSIYFTYKVKEPINKAFLKDFLKPVFVERGNPLRAKQEKAFMYFLDFVDECEDREVVTPNGNAVLPEYILIFFTGADRIPPLGFDGTATLTFTPGVLATSSTCGLVMNLPYCHETYETFKSFMIESLISNGGFYLA